MPLGQGNDIYQCIKLAGTTYYLDEIGQRIIARLNDTTLSVQCSVEKNGLEEYNKWKKIIENNSLAKDYYKDAYDFTKWFKSSGLQDLNYSDAIDTTIDDEGNIRESQHIFGESNTRKIFDFNTSNTNFNDNIENESSSFNEHRLAIIRHKIEVNLAIAITNYNAYSGATDNIFQMPKLSEEEWDSIIHNISLISFLQGMSIGGKVYNGYSIVTNSESKEVVLENNIYILGTKDGQSQYYKIGDRGLTDGTVNITAGAYAGSGSQTKSAGRINIEFERGTLNSADGTRKYYYYPLAKNNASYNSVIMQNEVNTYDDIYEYVNNTNTNLKTAFYTALGRERASTYKSWADYVDTSIKVQSLPANTGGSGDTGETITPVVQYKITYISNGQVKKYVNVYYNDNHTVASAEYVPGKTFVGWSDGRRTYQPGEIIANVTKDITLTAVYEEPTTTFQITFNPNGGNWNGSTQVKSITASTGSGGTKIQPEGGNPQRAGYTFKGWALSQASANNGKIDYEPNSTYTGSTSLSLWAVWNVNKTEENGGSGNTGSTEYQKGDINGDGKVNRTDYNLLLKYVWIGQGLTDEQKKRADINGDGKIDRSDLSELGKLI